MSACCSQRAAAPPPPPPRAAPRPPPAASCSKAPDPSSRRKRRTALCSSTAADRDAGGGLQERAAGSRLWLPGARGSAIARGVAVGSPSSSSSPSSSRSSSSSSNQQQVGAPEGSCAVTPTGWHPLDTPALWKVRHPGGRPCCSTALPCPLRARHCLSPRPVCFVAPCRAQRSRLCSTRPRPTPCRPPGR